MPPRLCPTCRRISQGDALFCPRDGSRMEEGQRIIAGKFVLGRELGRGNMGTVYEAEQPAMNRKVAVKLLHGDLTRNLEMVERFEREAQAAGRVRHPNVVTVYDCGSDEGQGYLVMELLSGETLGHRLAREGRLQPEVALPLWLAGVSAVAEAHRRGVVHRDLKPDNLLLDRGAAGGAEVLKVLDFGIARLQERRSGDRGTQSGMVMGTLLYMSPEQLQGLEVGPPTDVYALGLILCEMLTGCLPWAPGAEGAHLPGVHLLRLAQPPRPLGELCPALCAPAEVQALLDAALAPAPEDRPLDAGDLEARARAVLGRCPPPWLAAPPEDEWSSGEVTAVTPMHHVAGAPERGAADEEDEAPGAAAAAPEVGAPPEAAEPATTQTALPAEGARRGRALGAVAGACVVIAALAGGLLRARAPSPRPAAASSLTPAPPAAAAPAAPTGAAAPEATTAPGAAAATAAAAAAPSAPATERLAAGPAAPAAAAPPPRPAPDPAPSATAIAERPAVDPAAPAAAAPRPAALPRPAAAPAARVALEVAVLSPAGRPVTISCKGGGSCVTVDGSCKVLVRAGSRCSCTATATAYEPAQLSCPGAAAEGQRLEVRLEPAPF